MPIAKGRKTVLLEDILRVVSEFDILSHYLNIDRVPIVINSPLRDDRTPSMGLNTFDGKRINYMDFKTREKGGTFDLLSNIWGMPFDDVIYKINEDLPNIKQVGGYSQKDSKSRSPEVIESVRSKQIIMSSDIELKVKTREWRDYDLDYWEESGISKEWLEFGEVYPISHIFNKNKKEDKWVVIPADKYAYAYVEYKDGVESIKVYQPFSDKFKWRSKHNGSVWDLWNQLPEKGDRLIITSSRKDALTIWENTGIPSVSLQSETYMPKKHVVNQLKKRFKDIYVLYDNDFNKEVNTGRINGMALANSFNLRYIEIPRMAGEKDPSDIVKVYGREALRTMINLLIKKYEDSSLRDS